MDTRTLVAADAIAVAELWLAGAHESGVVDATFRPRVSVAEYGSTLREEFTSGTIVGWGRFSPSNELLGYLTARVSEASLEFLPAKYLYLLDLDVRPIARRRGIGSALVQVARLFAKERSLESIEVSWLLADARATAFWRRQGFAQYLARARSAAVVESPR